MARKTKILVIDDDQKLNQLLTDYLNKFNFQVNAYTHPENGIRAIKKEQPDLIILDIMLPDMDGFEVCKKIRQDYSVPIIMLTARGEVTDRVVGLELGADDYLPKPFEPRELVARIQTILRRSSKDIKVEIKRVGKITIDFNKHHVLLEGNPVDLTTAEFEILSLFMKNPGRVLTRNIIMDKIHGIEYDSFDRSVDVLISRLRRKLNDDSKNSKFIKTIWGTGYKFIDEENEDK